MFLKHSSTAKKAILMLYVDDIVLTGEYDEEIKRLKSLLVKEFEIKVLGNHIFSWYGGSSVQDRYFSFPLKICVGSLERNRNAWV